MRARSGRLDTCIKKATKWKRAELLLGLPRAPFGQEQKQVDSLKYSNQKVVTRLAEGGTGIIANTF